MFSKSFKQDAVLTPQSGIIDASSSTGAFNLPSGTTAQRPINPMVGAWRWNTTIGVAEAYVGSGIWQPMTQLNGSTPALAAPSAVYLQTVCNNYTNGAYYINLPTVGPTLCYCILDSACSGGGWIMAMKATRGSTFNYGASYWTTTTLINATDTTRNDGDAKFDVYNYYPATSWLAIFPDVGNGGDIPGGYGGWTWVDTGVTGTTTPVLSYMNTGTQITKYSNGVVYSLTSPTPTGSAKYSGSIWSNQNGFQWYGYNYTGNSTYKVRWGWAWNNEANQGSNDVSGGIGMNTASYSAGDYIGCCQVNTGINRSMRFEWYVR